jgi:hypothetical protein
MDTYTYERYNIDIAKEFSWHKQVVFPLVSSKSFSFMDDETLYYFTKYNTKLLNDGADARNARLSELEEWEKENGQDALYWAMKVVCDKDTLKAACLVANRSQAFVIIKKRIEYRAKLRFMKSEVNGDIPWDDVDDDYDNWV